MIFVCYFILFVNLLHSSDQADTFSLPQKWWKLPLIKQKLFLESITVENEDKYLAEMVTPLFNLTYDEQLEFKQNFCSYTTDRIVKRSETVQNRMTYKLLQIVPSPVTKAYRNRDEFSIGLGVDGNIKTVGWILGNPLLGISLSVHPKKIVVIKESHKQVAQVFEDFIRLSPVPAKTVGNDGGHWRAIFIRSNEAGNVMASVIVHPIGYTTEMIQEQQQALKEHFFKHLPNITLFHQQNANVKMLLSPSPFIRLYGKPYIMETLNGYKFKISPDTFFPINTLAAEVFYDNVIRRFILTPNITVIDIYSGSGIMSIMLSKFVKEVIGIESGVQSVTDAKDSAELNNVHNVNFVLGGAKTTLISVLKRLHPSDDVMLIANPRRGVLGMFIDNVVEVAKRELSWEVDYICEAECTKKFQKLLQPYPEYMVPKVVDSKRVYYAENLHMHPPSNKFS